MTLPFAENIYCIYIDISTHWHYYAITPLFINITPLAITPLIFAFISAFFTPIFIDRLRHCLRLPYLYYIFYYCHIDYAFFIRLLHTPFIIYFDDLFHYCLLLMHSLLIMPLRFLAPLLMPLRPSTFSSLCAVFIYSFSYVFVTFLETCRQIFSFTPFATLLGLFLLII